MAGVHVSTGGVSLLGPLTQPVSAQGTKASSIASSERDAEWVEVRDHLLLMRQLEEDWDGQGASAPILANVDFALEWVAQMHRFPRAISPSQAVPGVHGEVILEWQGEALYLAAEVPEPFRVEWMLALPGEPDRHWVTEGATPYFVVSEG